MYKHIRCEILLKIRLWPGDLLFASFFIIHIISVGEIGFAEKAIGKVDWRDSMTVDICSTGMEMRCGLNTPDSSSAKIFAFSLLHVVFNAIRLTVLFHSKVRIYITCKYTNVLCVGVDLELSTNS